ncbi:MAG TPA: LysR family transcriptional regulator, partial [Roseiarcus sp.]|nr:LysR family transcriptional regulator [Roseiarcus sp.]
MLKDLIAYRTFVAIAEQPSFTAAAEALGRSVQAVSRDLMRLEADLGSPLVLRTTRRRQLTTAGKEFYRRIAAALADLDRAEEDFKARTLRVAGPIKINGPTLFGPRVVTPIIAEFLARYKEVSIGLELNDAFVDPAASGADLTIRIGDTPPSSLIVRRLGEVRRVTVASPAYLEARGRPQRPCELTGHSCVVRRGDREAARWTFVTDEGETTVE